MQSWRVLLLPFLVEIALSQLYDFEEPWNGPNDIRLAERMPSIYVGVCGTKTSFLAVVSQETMWAPNRVVTKGDIPTGMSRV